MKMRHLMAPWIVFLLISLIASSSAPAFASEFAVEMRVDLGKDVGRHFGSLFEARDAAGNVVAGAGYAGAYNTQARSDRRLVHFYVKTDAPEFRPEPLPRVNDDAGTYLFEFDNRLFAKGRGGRDGRLHVWDSEAGVWRVDASTTPFSIHVGDGVLSTTPRQVTYAGRTILELASSEGFIAEPYYAAGHLVFRRRDPEAEPPLNELVACAWTPGDASASLEGAASIAMRTSGEFVYTHGQLFSEVLSVTNTGGVYVFDGTWRCILEPDMNTSFQIYAGINFRDTLLLGQYPTGELFAYDGTTLTHKPGWPPVMPGVSKHAREAQTLAIYGGELYAGVWPWAEVWKLDPQTNDWDLMGRMFTHPELTAENVHPYEEEATRLGSVLNRWGQRVTSMVPLGDSLYISTSSKGGTPYEPQFGFLDGDKWKEYGRVYRYRKPGALAAHTQWQAGPTTLEFRLQHRRMSVLQDGDVIGSTAFDASLPEVDPGQTAWGRGIFGSFTGVIQKRAVTATP